MKVFFHEDFYMVYKAGPAAREGRMEAIGEVIKPLVEFEKAEPADEADIVAVHTREHIDDVRVAGIYSICALSAGGAIQAATLGLTEPGFGLIRPPGHHASSDTSWGFCYFNNMAIALEALKRKKKIQTAMVLDIDMHYGDGTVDILGEKDWVKIHNPSTRNRAKYMKEIEAVLSEVKVDLIGISAGFDNHKKDWGKVLATEDYFSIGNMVRSTARASGGGCFAILEGGYNHSVLGYNVAALIKGLSS